MWTVSLHCERPPEMTCLRAPRTAKYAREEFRRARAVPGDLGEARGIASAPRPREGDSPRREEPSEAIPGDAVLRTDNKQQAPVPGGSTRPRSKVGRHCHSPLPSLRPAEVRSFTLCTQHDLQAPATEGGPASRGGARHIGAS